VIKDESVRKALTDASVDGKISCARCLEIGRERGIPAREIAPTLSEMGIKIVHCQLGCFP
jgi:hypothetical protein